MINLITNFLKRYWWIILIISLILLSLIVFSTIKKGRSNEDISKEKKDTGQISDGEKQALDKLDTVAIMTQDELNTALEALNKGIKIDDESNDFYVEKDTAGNKEGYNNPEPYNLPFLDYKSFQMGADQENLYIKHEVQGPFPTDVPYVDGDKIGGLILKVEEISVVGKENIITFTADGIRFGVIGDNNIREHSAFANFPANQPEDDSIGPNVDTGKFFGGPGYNYIVSSFPLDDLGLKYGDTISFFVASESGSDKWHHATIDLLKNLNGSKFGQTIIYTIGTNTYRFK